MGLEKMLKKEVKEGLEKKKKGKAGRKEMPVT